MKALFCTDGSEISFYALNNLHTYCKNLEIDVLCVIDWHFYPMYMNYPEPDFLTTYDEIADKILEHTREVIEQKGFKCGLLNKSWGSASDEIIKQTQKTKYDMIILGSHGKKGIKSWLGSVSRQIVNRLQEPIFISKEEGLNKKVLFATDGTDNSKHAIKEALELLQLENKELSIITVMEDITNLPLEVTSNKEWFNDYLNKRNCFAKNTLRETCAILKEHNLEAKYEYSLIGQPSTTIADTVEKEKIDLVVLGAHTKDKFSEFLLGSTSKRVLEKVKSSVLIISAQQDTKQ